jgi:hypothetical protein
MNAPMYQTDQPREGFMADRDLTYEMAKAYADNDTNHMKMDYKHFLQRPQANCQTPTLARRLPYPPLPPRPLALAIARMLSRHTRALSPRLALPV